MDPDFERSGLKRRKIMDVVAFYDDLLQKRRTAMQSTLDRFFKKKSSAPDASARDLHRWLYRSCCSAVICTIAVPVAVVRCRIMWITFFGPTAQRWDQQGHSAPQKRKKEMK